MTRLLSSLLCLTVGLAASYVHAQTGDVLPTEATALLKWLQPGAYKAWTKESAPHRPDCPPNTVRPVPLQISQRPFELGRLAQR